MVWCHIEFIGERKDNYNSTYKLEDETVINCVPDIVSAPPVADVPMVEAAAPPTAEQKNENVGTLDDASYIVNGAERSKSVKSHKRSPEFQDVSTSTS